MHSRYTLSVYILAEWKTTEEFPYRCSLCSAERRLKGALGRAVYKENRALFTLCLCVSVRVYTRRVPNALERVSVSDERDMWDRLRRGSDLLRLLGKLLFSQPSSLSYLLFF